MLRGPSVLSQSPGHRFQIWAHDVGDAADPRIPEQIVDRATALAPVVLQRLNGDVEPDLVAVLEAVRHGLGRPVDANGDAADPMLLDSLVVSGPREPNESEWEL